ncbi:calcium channel protein [Mortierella sp. GBA43]|nr:calcium channel protein [Mortierella sp. GBA43]
MPSPPLQPTPTSSSSPASQAPAQPTRTPEQVSRLDAARVATGSAQGAVAPGSVSRSGSGSGQGYKSLQNDNQDNGNDSTAPGISTWPGVARTFSDQTTAVDEYELNSVNDRTNVRPSPAPFQDSEDDTGDRASGSHSHRPRRKGFHNNPGNSSRNTKSSRSSGPSSRLASVKQALNRASTRVIGTTSSHHHAPAVPEIPSTFRQQTAEGAVQEARASYDDVNTATVGQPEDYNSGSEASLVQHSETVYQQEQRVDPPLEGYSLFVFGPDNPLRKKINRFLNQPMVEIFMLFLLVLNLVFLIILLSSPTGSDSVWGAHWTDYGLLAIFILYTLEILARVIVSGLAIYPKDGEKIRKFFGKKPRTDNLHDTNPTILRKRRATMTPVTPSKEPEHLMSPTTRARATTILDFAVGRPTAITQRLPTYIEPLIEFKPQFVESKAQLPFLRHTFNRIDLVAVMCFWVDVGIMVAGVQGIYVFKALSAMRTLRLLNITSGSSTILHSLKKSAPLLVNIVLFIAFFFIIFCIIGVQSFKGSFSRRCVLATNYTMDTGVNFDTAISFDNIYSAMVPVYVLMTGQTWTDMMYKIMDAEYSWSSVYFVLVVLIMNFWILNLFVAVINEMFAKIRDDSSNNSAFKSGEEDSKDNTDSGKSTEASSNEGMKGKDKEKETPENIDILAQSVNNFTYADDTVDRLKRDRIERLELFWVAVVIADLVFQCLPQYKSPPSQLLIYNRAELWFTVAFAVDVIIRFIVWLPSPKKFFQSKKNNVDLFLAVVTLIIQIPPIRNSRVYVYLSVFQVVRIYRVIIYVERLRFLIQRVVGSWVGLLNLISFIAMFLVVVSVMAGVLFREVVPSDSSSMNFSDFYVSYLGMYQLFSGENWTDILYNVMSVEVPWHQVVVATVFIIAFYSFANFVLVNMLIAIIMENFEGEQEEAKHAQQIQDYAARRGYPKEKERQFVLYLQSYLKRYTKSIGVHYIPTGLINRVRKGLARQFLLGDNDLFHGVEKDPLTESSDRRTSHFGREKGHKGDHRFSSQYKSLHPGALDEMEGFRKFYTTSHGDEESAQDTSVKADLRHRSLFFFGPRNKLRRLLQQIVTPGNKTRIEGEKENVMLSRPFNIFITLAVLASVIVAVITTPVWRYHQTLLDPHKQTVLFNTTDYVFMGIFTVEFLIRIIADGFFFTPDAYLRTLWNQIDFFVLLSLYAPLVTNLTKSQGTSRFFRSLKSLRALRLINQSSYIKDTFHAVLVAGFPQLFDASMLCMALLVPFAIYGMRLFSGLFFSCNDQSEGIHSVNDCTGMFQNPDTGLTLPRVWANPHVYSFDNFGASFLILFEIVSQEGWSGVMETSRNVVGLGLQSSTDASRYNGIFFVLFNLAGGYFVLSLFVAIVIENYTKRTGTAFMTADQRRWLDLKKLLRGIKMSKATYNPPANPIRAICFHIVSPKRGWFARTLTGITILNAIVLSAEHVKSGSGEEIMNWIFLGFMVVFVFEAFAKICGLGWHAYRVNRWNLYNGTISTLALLVTVMRLSGLTQQSLIQTQKLLLTAILFRLVPQSDSLNQLFMTMAASIGSIASLFAVWLVVFAVYGIMFMEIFGLTSFGPNGSRHVNFRNIGTTLLMMARMSTGEGWNDLMHDFAVEKPQCVNQPDNYLLSDCGSTAWAYTLFITFNIISMYIFTNMFIVVVMHNFSYVYQIAPGFSLITREEIRHYKRFWAEVDTEHTGYIQKQDLARFLGKLRGAFDMRIYNEEHSIVKLQSRLETAKPSFVNKSARELLGNTPLVAPTAERSHTKKKILILSRASRRLARMSRSGESKKNENTGVGTDVSYKIHQDYNLEAFNSAIGNLDKLETRRKRRVYNFLYTEAVMSMDPIPSSGYTKAKRLLRWGTATLRGVNPQPTSSAAETASDDYELGKVGEDEDVRGISFQKMLMTLAHYKLIEDDHCLSIGEQLRHRQKMDWLHAHVNVVDVKSILLTMFLRRRFMKYYHEVQSIRARTKQTPPASPVVGRGDDEQGQEPESSTSKDRKQGKASAGGLSPTPAASTVELLDPKQAEDQIDSLRSEWRPYVMGRDLMLSITNHGQGMLGQMDSMIEDFENGGPSAGGDTSEQPGGLQSSSSNSRGMQQPRSEVLGRDYL